MDTNSQVFSQNEPTIQYLILDMDDLKHPTSSDHHTVSNGSIAIQIEMYARMICYGIHCPFPYSRKNLSPALTAIKSLLNQISLAELVVCAAELKDRPVKPFAHDVQSMEKLDELLDCPVIAGSIPSLREAVKFIDSNAQEEVYAIIKRKLQRD